MRNQLVTLILLSLWSASLCSKDCYKVHYVTCENGSMTLEVDESISEFLHNKHCEHGLYYSNDTLFAEAMPMQPEQNGMVEEMIRRSVKIHACPSEVRWKVNCARPMVERLVCYKVNETNPGHVTSQRTLPSSESLNPRVHWLVIIPLAMVILVVIVLCTKWQTAKINKNFVTVV
ncbi:uncharacterized protein LOC143473288 [Brachyhypopomus gauderio]|uniref:uncharacterized protein LOC143473288 n=1 Tax=Brachyhypopomus gauderio TaxID=698409 RepID=UPI004041FF39